MDKNTFSTLMYALTKHAARESFIDFLEGWGIPEAEYDAIREYLKETYGVRTYV